MKPIEFEGQTAVVAKDQPEYLPLPAHISLDGCVTSCWRLSLLERIKILFTGCVWSQLLTFGHNQLQPQRLTIDRPELGSHPILRKWEI